LFGRDGNDVLEGGEGNDRLDGGAGDDELFGGAGNDILQGGDGNDFFSGGTGNDRAIGGEGNDTYEFDPFHGSDRFDGGNGGGWTDVIRLDADSGIGGPEDDTPWSIEVDGAQLDYDLASNALDLAPDTAGVITLADGSQIEFSNVERIEW
jgi:Ca2+-binding RTX toxin-like protein